MLKIKIDYLDEKIKHLKDLTEIYDKQIELEKQAQILRSKI